MSPRIDLFVGTFSWLFIVALIAATISAGFVDAGEPRALLQRAAGPEIRAAAYSAAAARVAAAGAAVGVREAAQ